MYTICVKTLNSISKINIVDPDSLLSAVSKAERNDPALNSEIVRDR